MEQDFRQAEARRVDRRAPACGVAAQSEHRVWRNSTPAALVEWRVISPSERQAVWKCAQRLRVCHQIIVSAVELFQSMLFRFLNMTTGRLDPGYEALSQATGQPTTTVWRNIRRLCAAGLLIKQRRKHRLPDGRVKQSTNAYFIPRTLPAPCLPLPGTWGDHPCGQRDPLLEALVEQRRGGSGESMLRQLEHAAPGTLAAALASFGAAIIRAPPG